MKTKFKVFWPIIALLVLNACQKEKELVNPIQPTPIPVPSVDKNALVITADNTGLFYANNPIYILSSNGYPSAVNVTTGV